MLRRVRRHAGLCAAASSMHSLRSYTPVYAPADPEDRLGKLSVADEMLSLWGTEQDGPIVGAQDAITRWIRWGNHPLLSETPRNVWAGAEDRLGTNIVDSSNSMRQQESIKFWREHFEHMYLGILRQQRDSSANDIGTLTAMGALEDEADRPDTDWGRDSEFVKLQELARRFLKVNVRKMDDLELVLRTTTPEKFCDFMLSVRKPSHASIPLPSAALWHYDEAKRREWCISWQKRRLEAESTLSMISGLCRKSPGEWQAITSALAEQLKAIDSIRAARYKRQVEAGVVKAWDDMSESEKFELCLADRALLYASLVEGDVDPEDKRDSSAEWIEEQGQIHALAQKELGHSGLTLEAVWKHCIALDELETEHLHTDPTNQKIAAAALQKARDAHGIAAVQAAQSEALARATFDNRSQVLEPYVGNPIYLKTQWARFGASTILQHTSASRHHLHYNAQTLEVAAAVATLFYRLKPLSTALNYTTPYNYRRSLVSNYVTFGLAFTRSANAAYFRPTALLADAEESMKIVSSAVKHSFGVARRATIPVAQAVHRRHETLVEKAALLPLVSATDGAGTVVAAPDTVAFCSLREIVVDWPSPHLKALAMNPPPRTASGLLEKAERLRRGGIEVSLWRRVAAGKRTPFQERALQTKEMAEKLVGAAPQLAAVKAEVTATLERLTETKAPHGIAEPQDEWEFITMIHDNHPLTENQRVPVVIPYHAIGVGNEPGRAIDVKGEYRLRIRCFDNQINPLHLPHRCSETFTEVFNLVDALPQVARSHFGSDNVTLFDGRELVPFFRALRSAGVTTPLQLEFEAGQVLSPKGEASLLHIRRLFAEGRHFSLGAREMLTDPQLEAEPKVRRHWELIHPGATEEEWFGVRRGVLDAAFEVEKEWWLEEPLLEEEIDPTNWKLAARYSHDVCQVLCARGTSSAVAGLDVPNVSCAYAGDGTVRSLEINQLAAQERKVSLDAILSDCQLAINRAHDRLNTLSAVKTSEFQKRLQLYSWLSSSSTEFGGKYGRTYKEAYRAALRELDEAGAVDLDREKEVDRFASQDHPELRRRTFVARFDTNGGNYDDPQSTHNSQWGNEV